MDYLRDSQARDIGRDVAETCLVYRRKPASDTEVIRALHEEQDFEVTGWAQEAALHEAREYTKYLQKLGY